MALIRNTFAPIGTLYLLDSLPIGIGGELRPHVVAVRAIAIGQHPDQRVRVPEVLPDADDVCAVLLEDGDFLFAEALNAAR